MYEAITQLLIIVGMLAAFIVGYRAGRREEKLIQMPAHDMKILNMNDEHEAPETEEKIREDMENSRSIMTGFDFINE